MCQRIHNQAKYRHRIIEYEIIASIISIKLPANLLVLLYENFSGKVSLEKWISLIDPTSFALWQIYNVSLRTDHHNSTNNNTVSNKIMKFPPKKCRKVKIAQYQRFCNFKDFPISQLDGIF